jgi:hypothetical protein
MWHDGTATTTDAPSSTASAKGVRCRAEPPDDANGPAREHVAPTRVRPGPVSGPQDDGETTRAARRPAAARRGPATMTSGSHRGRPGVSRTGRPARDTGRGAVATGPARDLAGPG